MSVQMVAVKDLVPGSVLGDAVLSVGGKILLGKEVVLTPRNISLLNAWDVKFVYIHGGEEEPAPQPPQEQGQAEREAAPAGGKFYGEYDAIVTNTVQAFDFIRKQRIVPVPYLKETAGHIYSSLASDISAVTGQLLASDYQAADFISRHSVMVAFFAGIIAGHMKWSEADIHGVALTGLLHDVGNVMAGKNDEVKGQTRIAETAALLKDVKGLSGDVILGVVQHRECIDGSGIPTGASGPRIHPYAKIIAVADMFHTRAYDTGTMFANPFPVLDILAHEMFGKFDPAVCHTFISRVRDSLLRNKVLLSDGREAEVIYFHPAGSCLPVVRTAENQIIDLSRDSSLNIRRIVAAS